MVSPLSSLAYRYRHVPPGYAGAVIRQYLDEGLSVCQIAAAAGRKTTTPATVRRHLERAGIGSMRWCPMCRRYEETRAAP